MGQNNYGVACDPFWRDPHPEVLDGLFQRGRVLLMIFTKKVYVKTQRKASMNQFNNWTEGNPLKQGLETGSDFRILKAIHIVYEERVRGPETRGSLPAEKAWPEERSHVTRRLRPARSQRLRGGLKSRGYCDNPRLFILFNPISGPPAPGGEIH
ncbi:hypothetical protein NDU88_006231 [Pleurodeles waltl]|uniref:Uncharacterized protein n=1 Tax=Pleurodeles waltl TaxID=8319 RepID=A0AAV7PHV0_PLEWA|nr:hypothetical protein NDU88_006231 [Pleurodeles waltl]